MHFIDLHRSWGALYSFALHNPKQFVGLHRSLQKLLQGREASHTSASASASASASTSTSTSASSLRTRAPVEANNSLAGEFLLEIKQIQNLGKGYGCPVYCCINFVRKFTIYLQCSPLA